MHPANGMPCYQRIILQVIAWRQSPLDRQTRKSADRSLVPRSQIQAAARLMPSGWLLAGDREAEDNRGGHDNMSGSEILG